MHEEHLQIDCRPNQIDHSCFIAENAIVLGDVHLKERSSVWFGAVVRGDSATIRIGKESNIQDLACLHADPGYPCSIGERVTVGHAAVVHGATIDDDSLIGIRAVVLNGAIIGKNCILGAGAVVTEGQHIPDNSVAMGIPAKIMRQTSLEDTERIRHAAMHYVKACETYRSQDQPTLSDET